MRRRDLGIVLLTLASVAKADGAPKPPVKEPELRAELLRRAKAEQDARAALTEWMKQSGNKEASLDPAQKAEFRRLTDTLQRTDKENTDRLGRIVERYGWPTYTLVGKDGAQAAWLLAQHADSSPKFQRKCLDLMAKLPRGEISQQNVAYLTDRVLLTEGKKQLYGTQVTLTDGKWKPRPLEDEANVDKRRSAVGLPPLAEYLKSVEAFYGTGTKK
jgi:hypothetical protein